MINTAVVAATLDEVAAEYPDLDKIKYWYEVIPTEELLHDYAEVLVEKTEAFPVVETLASSSTILSADTVRCYLVDYDPVLEGVIIDLGKQINKSEVVGQQS